MIGQTHLRKHLEKLLKNNDLPHLMIISGPKGQGKRTLVQELLVSQLRYTAEDLKVDNIRNLINHTLTISSPTFYLLYDAHEMTIQAQNALLKTAEEPPENVYIILTVADSTKILPTIFSRATEFKLDMYTEGELAASTTDKLLRKVCTNPGQIQEFQQIDYTALYDHCKKVMQNVAKVSYANTFNIIKGIDLEKLPMFIQMLMYVYQEELVSVASTIPSEQLGKLQRSIKVLYKYSYTLVNKSVNKQNALEQMFIELKEAEYGI